MRVFIYEPVNGSSIRVRSDCWREFGTRAAFQISFNPQHLRKVREAIRASNGRKV